MLVPQSQLCQVAGIYNVENWTASGECVKKMI